jgi:hypothetical protein
MVKVWPFENRVKKYDRFRLAWNICDEREREKEKTNKQKKGDKNEMQVL